VQEQRGAGKKEKHGKKIRPLGRRGGPTPRPGGGKGDPPPSEKTRGTKIGINGFSSKRKIRKNQRNPNGSRGVVFVLRKEKENKRTWRTAGKRERAKETVPRNNRGV